MENTTLLSKLSKLAEGHSLDKARFGRSGALMFWVGRQELPVVCRRVRDDETLRLDFLEHISVMQMDDMLVASYFLRSNETKSHLILRTTATLARPDEEAELPSVRDVWAMARPMEEELGEMFGIRFSDFPPPQRLVLSGGRRFPLRKGPVDSIPRAVPASMAAQALKDFETSSGGGA